MRKLAIALGLAVASGTIVLGQDDAAFQKWMKSVAAETGAIRKANPKTGAEVAASAEKVAAIYDEQKSFWEKRSVADAAKISDEGKAAALAVAAAAKAGDGEKAAAAFQTLGGTCRPCHEAHREKVGDTYKIK